LTVISNIYQYPGFITAFTKASHRNYPELVESNPHHEILSLGIRFIIDHQSTSMNPKIFRPKSRVYCVLRALCMSANLIRLQSLITIGSGKDYAYKW